MAFVIPRQPLNDPLRPARFGLRLAPGTRVVRREEWLLWCEAERAVQAARSEAAQIEADARSAFEAERQRGHAEGRQEAQLEQATRMIEQVGRAVDYFGRVEQRMVELVMQAVQRVIGEFGDRDRVVAVVKGALAVVRNQKQITLRVAPAQVAAVNEAQNELLAAFPGVGYLDVVADPRLAADACILETEIGVVEASVQGQLQALRQAFANVLGSRT
jgi:type III secretion protein L